MNTGIQENHILNGWKEIASYFGRGIRTVQRMEIERSLPVRRPREKKRSPVFALRIDLDAWLQGANHINGSLRKARPRIPSELRNQTHELQTRLHASCLELVGRQTQIMDNVTRLRSELTRAMGLAGRLSPPPA